MAFALAIQESMRLRSCYQWFLCSPFYRNSEEILSGNYDELPVENVVGCCGSLEDNESSESQDSLITCMSMDNAGQELDSSNVSMVNESQESASGSSVSENSESPAPLESFAFIQHRAPLRSGDGRRPFTAFISGAEYKALIKGCYYVPNPENPRIPLSGFAARIGGQCGAEYDHAKRCIMERIREREERRTERRRKKNEERRAGLVNDEEKKKYAAKKAQLKKKMQEKKEKKQEKKEKKQEEKEKKRARRAAAAAATANATVVDDAASKLVHNSEGNSGVGESSSSSRPQLTENH